MGTKDPRVDAYIARQPDFAKEICTRLRAIVHEAAPAIGEDIKWGHVAFMHKGIVCGLAAFKAHVVFHFWKASLLTGSHSRRATDDKTLERLERITSVADLPPKAAIAGYVKAAFELNDGAVKAPRMAKAAKKTRAPLRTPPTLAKALARNAKAKKTYDGFSPSHKREYVEWITEAKSEETRDRRIEQALGWMAEGKPRNWKYMKRV
jgi:uncharacterized protein YdeI (YjbR/CyaY-like superfamily)